MTDITELAQREKFEAWAEEAGALPWGILKKHRNQDGSYPGPHYTYMWKAWQAASAELEKAQTEREEFRRRFNLERLILEDADRDLETLRQRIAELESRTVTIEPFRSFVTDADLAALHRFAECCDDPESGGHDLEKEQVRRLEAIGALQRSGRISYITGFGDFLISLTAGIKWEAE
ncbi:hypothetical protein [Klebsiella michiganensis]|uniref:hypothetical protein n=1 Tax=Klebsiella michiganensis TaxID=1134687 RepID=UPI003F89A5E2